MYIALSWLSLGQFADCHYAPFMTLHVIGAKCLGFVKAGSMQWMCAQKYSQPSRLAPTVSGLEGVKAQHWLQLLIKNQFDTLKKKEHLIREPMLHQLLDFILNMVIAGHYKFLSPIYRFSNESQYDIYNI